MRVLFVDDSGRPGGGQLGLLRYLQQPSELKRSVVLVEDGPIAERIKQISSVDLTVLGGTAGRLKKYLRVARLAAKTRSAHADVIVANSLRAAIQLSFVPFLRPTKLFYVRELLSEEWLSGWKRRLVVGFVLRRFDGFIVNSRWTEDTIPREVQHKPRVVAYPVSGISTVAESDDSRRNSAGGPLRVLSLGRIARWKGVEALLNAADEIAARGRAGDVEIWVAGGTSFGDSELAAEIDSRAASSDETIRVLGHVEDVANLLSQVDVLYSGSLIPEPFGQVIVQALAAGVPVVSSRGGGPAEIIGDSIAGRFFDPGDPVQIAEVLLALADDRESLAAMSAATSEIAARFIDKETSARLDAAIASLASAA